MYTGKDTYAAGRLVQKWRKPSDHISQGKLLTKDVAPNTFHIGVDDVNKCMKEVKQLLEENKSFAILIPVSITSEIARQENKDGQRCHDEKLAIKISTMFKITLASSSEVWLINLPGEAFNHFLSNVVEGLGLTGCKEVFQESLAREQAATIDEPYDPPETLDAFPATQSRNRDDTTITTPAANSITSGERHTSEHETRTITPEWENHKIKWKNVPRQPIPQLNDISQWIGHQLNHQRMPKEYKNVPPDGKQPHIRTPTRTTLYYVVQL